MVKNKQTKRFFGYRTVLPFLVSFACFAWPDPFVSLTLFTPEKFRFVGYKVRKRDYLLQFKKMRNAKGGVGFCCCFSDRATTFVFAVGGSVKEKERNPPLSKDENLLSKA